jgi:hypothetical protein
MRWRRRSASLGACATLVALGLLQTACEECIPLTATSAPVGVLVLDAGSHSAVYSFAVHAGCTDGDCTAHCFAPSVHTRLAGTVSADTVDPGALEIVRIEVVPKGGLAPSSTLVPAFPVDVVLDGAAPSQDLAIDLSYDCYEGECDAAFEVNVTRIDPTLMGSVAVTLAAASDYTSDPDGDLTVVLQKK